VRYYHFENVTRQKRRKKKFTMIALATALLLLVASLLILRDLVGKQEVTTIDSGVTKTITKLDDYKTFDEQSFSLRLPSDWQRSKTSTPNLVIYKSGQKTDEAISLEVYINGGIPSDFSTTRALPIKVEDGKIIPGLLSNHCNEFTKPKEGFGDSVVSPPQTSLWQGISFMCNFSKVLNFAATINKESGFSTRIAGPTTSSLYLFSYTDHTSRPDFLVFNTILSTFSPK